MKAHPIIESPFRWIPMLVLALILVAFQVALVCGYTGNDYLPALVAVSYTHLDVYKRQFDRRVTCVIYVFIIVTAAAD